MTVAVTDWMTFTPLLIALVHPLIVTTIPGKNPSVTKEPDPPEERV